MIRHPLTTCVLALGLCSFASAGAAEKPLHQRIDEAIAAGRANFAAALTSPLAEFLDIEAANMTRGMSTKEFDEAVRAFLDAP